MGISLQSGFAGFDLFLCANCQLLTDQDVDRFIRRNNAPFECLQMDKKLCFVGLSLSGEKNWTGLTLKIPYLHHFFPPSVTQFPRHAFRKRTDSIFVSSGSSPSVRLGLVQMRRCWQYLQPFLHPPPLLCPRPHPWIERFYTCCVARPGRNLTTMVVLTMPSPVFTRPSLLPCWRSPLGRAGPGSTLGGQDYQGTTLQTDHWEVLGII